MRALVFHRPKGVSVDTVDDPRIEHPSDVILRVTSTAICGSDLHIYNGYFPQVKPMVLGHEFMGVVEEVGADVKKLRKGDRVVVPFPIACGQCNARSAGLFSACENSNPNAWMQEKTWGHATAGMFGYSHMTGGFAGGQAEYARVPYDDVGPHKVPDNLTDDQVILLTDVFPTGWMAAEMADIRPGTVVAIWGGGPIGQMAAASARHMGAEKIIMIDRLPYRLRIAMEHSGVIPINFDEVDLGEALIDLTAGRGPDACIDAVGMESVGHGPIAAMDRVAAATRIMPDRATPLREVIQSVRNGGNISIIGDYMALVNEVPMGSLMNRGITVRTGQTHVQRYIPKLLELITSGQLDPSFIITHRPRLDQAAEAYKMFNDKQDECLKVVMKTVM